jgi:hemolysin III
VAHQAISRTRQSVGEEIANSISHGVGLLGALAAVPALIGAALRRSDPPDLVGVSVFATTLVLLYLASTLYHALPSPRAKPVLRVLDHGAVYLLIAGTYTPFALGPLRGPWGSLLFALVWSLAVLGVVVTALGGLRYPRLTTGAYLALGWLGVLVIRVLWVRVPLAGLAWLFAGGLAYTVGVVFLTARRMRYGHFVWHLFVLAGTSCHVVAVLYYAAQGS